MFFKKKEKPAAEPLPSPADDLKGRPIGLVLTKMGKVTKPQVLEALTVQRTCGGKLGEILVQLGYTTTEDVNAALAAQAGAKS